MWRKILPVNPFNGFLRGSSKITTNVKCMSRLVSGEPKEPFVGTSIPGPRSNKMLSEMKKIQVSKLTLSLTKNALVI